MVGFSLTKGTAYKATIVNYNNTQEVFKTHFDMEKNTLESFSQLDFLIFQCACFLPLCDFPSTALLLILVRVAHHGRLQVPTTSYLQ